jgi:hypothetical protein
MTPGGAGKDVARFATIDADGWQLESAEVRHAVSPDTFWIPPRAQRERLQPGDGVKLLFQIAIADAGSEQGVERMWVLVRRRMHDRYLGVLDSTPTSTTPASPLVRGCAVVFAPEHVADISAPSREYIVEQYGEAFFGKDDVAHGARES